jgi:bifunctional UDP-N-acetylglucosamine pyrophosphorylase/glucosamine-1-phosphate N-acetyltransferase
MRGHTGNQFLFLPCDLPQLEACHLAALLEAHSASDAPASTLHIAGTATGVFAARREAAAALHPAADPHTLFPHARPVALPGAPLIDVNTRADLARAEKALRREIIERLMEEGVTFLDPEHTYIHAGVRIGRDTVVYPGTILEGATALGRRCVIGPYTHLVDTVVGDEAEIRAATVRECRLGDRVRIGPFANLRPGCEVGEGAKVGTFVEMKNARVGAHVSAAHLAYLGDADVGDGVNIGAGVITCNYDGKRKHRTTIGPGAFVGSNSVLIAPVTVGAGAYVAAHSAINQDVPADALGIARSRQENKEGWAARRRQERGKD